MIYFNKVLAEAVHLSIYEKINGNDDYDKPSEDIIVP